MPRAASEATSASRFEKLYTPFVDSTALHAKSMRTREKRIPFAASSPASSLVKWMFAARRLARSALPCGAAIIGVFERSIVAPTASIATTSSKSIAPTAPFSSGTAARIVTWVIGPCSTPSFAPPKCPSGASSSTTWRNHALGSSAPKGRARPYWSTCLVESRTRSHAWMPAGALTQKPTSAALIGVASFNDAATYAPPPEKSYARCAPLPLCPAPLVSDPFAPGNSGPLEKVHGSGARAPSKSSSVVSCACPREGVAKTTAAKSMAMPRCLRMGSSGLPLALETSPIPQAPRGARSRREPRREPVATVTSWPPPPSSARA